jgi:superfamily II DNA/RNA helicase
VSVPFFHIFSRVSDTENKLTTLSSNSLNTTPYDKLFNLNEIDLREFIIDNLDNQFGCRFLRDFIINLKTTANYRDFFNNGYRAKFIHQRKMIDMNDAISYAHLLDGHTLNVVNNYYIKPGINYNNPFDKLSNESSLYNTSICADALNDYIYAYNENFDVDMSSPQALSQASSLSSPQALSQASSLSSPQALSQASSSSLVSHSFIPFNITVNMKKSSDKALIRKRKLINEDIIKIIKYYTMISKKYDYELNELQLKVIKAMYTNEGYKKDILIKSSCGTGKTFSALARVLAYSHQKIKCTVIWITCYKSLEIATLAKFKKYDDLLNIFYCKDSGSIMETINRMNDESNDKYGNIILLNPSLCNHISNICKNMNHSTYIVLDEIHAMLDDISYRETMYNLVTNINQLRYRAGQKMIILALSGTIHQDHEHFIINQLFNDDYIIISNMKILIVDYRMYVENISIAQLFAKLHKHIEIIMSRFPDKKIIIYIRTKDLLIRFFYFLRKNKVECNFFHSDIPYERKKNIFNLLESNKLKILLSTKSLAYGIDIPNIKNIIFVGVPESLNILVQMSGRSVRNKNDKGIIHIYINDDINNKTEYLLKEKEKKQFIELVNVLKSKDLCINNYIENFYNFQSNLICNNCVNCKRIISDYSNINIYRETKSSLRETVLNAIDKNKKINENSIIFKYINEKKQVQKSLGILKRLEICIVCNILYGDSNVHIPMSTSCLHYQKLKSCGGCFKCLYANCKIRSQCRVTDIIKNSRDMCWSCFIPYEFHPDSNCIKTVKYSLLSLLVKQNSKIDSLKAYFNNNNELLLKHINKISTISCFFCPKRAKKVIPSGNEIKQFIIISSPILIFI